MNSVHSSNIKQELNTDTSLPSPPISHSYRHHHQQQQQLLHQQQQHHHQHLHQQQQQQHLQNHHHSQQQQHHHQTHITSSPTSPLTSSIVTSSASAAGGASITSGSSAGTSSSCVGGDECGRSTSPSSSSIAENIHACSQCSASFPNRDLLEKHELQHSPNATVVSKFVLIVFFIYILYLSFADISISCAEGWTIATIIYY